MSPQLYWRLQRKCLCQGSVSPQLYYCYIGVCRRDVSVSELCRRSYFGVSRGGVCVSDLWHLSYIGVCRGRVCVSDLRRRSCLTRVPNKRFCERKRSSASCFEPQGLVHAFCMGVQLTTVHLDLCVSSLCRDHVAMRSTFHTPPLDCVLKRVARLTIQKSSHTHHQLFLSSGCLILYSFARARYI